MNKTETIETAIMLYGTPKDHIIYNGDYSHIPRVGEKIVIDGTDDAPNPLDRFAQVYEVLDVVYTIDGSSADIFVKHIGGHSSFLLALSKSAQS